MLEFLTGYGIWILGIAFLIDDLGVPFPSSSIMFTVAVWARTSGEIFLPLFVLEALLLSVLGNTILYWWGRRGAREWLRQHGHRIFLPRKRLQKIECFFEEKHGPRTILLSSFVNNVRPACALLAGASGMRPGKFFPMNILGSSISLTVIATTGYLLGEPAHTLWRSDGKLIIAGIVAYITGYVIWRLIKKIFHLNTACQRPSS